MKAVVDAERVVVALRDELGIGPVSRIEPADDGSFNAVFRVVVADRGLYVRINHDRDAYPRELCAYRLAAASGMPVPKIVGYLPDVPTIDAAMLVLGEIEGESLDTASLSDNARRRVYEHAGAMLHRLHEAPVDGYGMLTVRDGMLRGESASWRDYWLVDNPYDRNLEDIARDGLVSGAVYARVEAAIEAMCAAEIGPARLLHNDFTGVHIFTDGRNVTGVIDFGNALAGDPRYDIAMARYFRDALEADALTRGYGPLALDPMVRTYEIYVSAIKVLWIYRIGNLDDARRRAGALGALVAEPGAKSCR